jgi:hypothetical protein
MIFTFYVEVIFHIVLKIINILCHSMISLESKVEVFLEITSYKNEIPILELLRYYLNIDFFIKK